VSPHFRGYGKRTKIVPTDFRIHRSLRTRQTHAIPAPGRPLTSSPNISRDEPLGQEQILRAAGAGTSFVEIGCLLPSCAGNNPLDSLALINMDHTNMESHDDDLKNFEAHGAAPFRHKRSGYVDHDGARIWYATHGSALP